MNTKHQYPRLIEHRLEEALADSPVTLIHGPRQSGKTTIAKVVGKRSNREYITLDDPVMADAINADPVGFIADLEGDVTIDEVQRAPALFTAIKLDVDRNRRAGRFLLTGSANVLAVPRLSESLAGRMEIVRLHPLSQVELANRPVEFLERALAIDFPGGSCERLGKRLPELIVRGGYPEPISRPSSHRQSAWYRDYISTLIQRDVQDIARIRRLDVLPRLLSLVARYTACLLNSTDLSGPFQISRPTIREYITVLSQIFLLDELLPWHNNHLKRLVKTPKLHMGDTGLACALLGIDADMLWADRKLLGQMLETFVFQELRRQASGSSQNISFYHLRDKEKHEVDVVLEFGSQRLIGIEVKAAASVNKHDFKGLRQLRSAAGETFRCGLVLYDGERTASFGENMYAVPLRRLWGD